MLNGDVDVFLKVIIIFIDNFCLLERMKDNCLFCFNVFFYVNIMNKYYLVIYEEFGCYG